MSSRSVIALACLLALAGCIRPEVKIDMCSTANACHFETCTRDGACPGLAPKVPL